MTVTATSREIDGKGRTVRELLAARKYSIDYYQREYRWQQKHIAELLNDLSGKFLESYDDSHERSAVADYGHYFLGSIIISDKDGQKFIIDAQQRLTALTLLLIYLHRQLSDVEQKGQLAELIFSQKFGKRSFNLDLPERTACMEALYRGEDSELPPACNERAAGPSAPGTHDRLRRDPFRRCLALFGVRGARQEGLRDRAVRSDRPR